ncbi:hypothetical protein GGD83_003677 [Rhodoblastus sphagnicola]|uniref:hypothetical protein n=1 Tax=Rhodoblastus sphagnicola TaxID=333368 RepID=UPI00180B1684|nr:hypothetical protein [Rhodoblastus sphagnicola]MBB4199853.1 hypothetical protein [Rhodoblastus sphagnicola]
MIQGGAAPAYANSDIDGVWKISKATGVLAVIDGPIPFTDAGRKLYEAHKGARARGVYDFDLTQSRCASPGPVRLMLSPDRLRIWTRPDTVTIQFEWNRLLRLIDMTGKEHKPALVATAMGSSSGVLEKGTLVVKTNNVSEQTLLDDVLPHSEDIQITEQIRLKDPKTLEDRITINDPANYTRPWDAVVTYARGADTAFAEDVCLDRLSAGQPPLPR